MTHQERVWIRTSLDQQLTEWQKAAAQPIPSGGWLRAVREAMRMPLRLVADRLGISCQALHALEEREQLGTITLNRMMDIAGAMELTFCYAVVPLNASLEGRMKERAEETVEKTWKHKEFENRQLLGLEDEQGNKFEGHYELDTAPWDATHRGLNSYFEALREEMVRGVNKREFLEQRLVAQTPPDFWDDRPP